MSVFTEQVLIDKLSHMSNSQQSIESNSFFFEKIQFTIYSCQIPKTKALSHWILYHRKHVDKSVKVWEKEIFKGKKKSLLFFSQFFF